jgi:hypothetical protein
VLQIVCAPLHIHLEPHRYLPDFDAAGSLVSTVVSEEAHDKHGHHDQHSAAQHKLTALRLARLALGQMLPVAAMPWVDARPDLPEMPIFEFSGLSPPELPRCWQFLFRAALPIRAPSCLS